MFINDLFENKNVKEGWDEVKSRVGDVAKKTADTLVSAGAAAGDAVSGALDVIPRPFDEKTYQDRVSKPYPKTDKKKLDEEDSPEIGSTVNVTTVKGRTYTGELVRIDDNSVALRVYAAGGIPHAQDDTESRSQIIVMKKDHVVSIEDALEEDIPPPENARKTQIASTLGTYKKAGAMLDKAGIQGKSLDFGAGLGKGTAELGKDAESYEPYPREDFKPNYIDATQIPSNSYSRIVNLNVLNVVPNVEGHRIRDEIVRQIGRVLAPGGMALITTRGRDVLTIKGTPGEEPMSMISSIGTYQKGFTSKELKEYVQSVLGDDFEVSSAKLGPAGVMIKKHKESVDETAARDRLHQRHQEIRKQAGRPHTDYYKELKATFDLPDDERWAKVAELKKKYKVAESLRDGEHHTWTVHFDDGTSQQVNVPSDEFDVRGYFAKRGKKVTKVDKSYAVQGQQQDKVKPDNYDDRPDRAAKAQAAYDRRMTEQGVAEEEMPGLSPEMERARQMQQIMISNTPPQDNNLNMLKAWAEYSPQRRQDYYVIAKFGSAGPNRNIFSNSVQKTLDIISDFPDMDEEELYDQFGLDQRDADRLYAAYENVAYELDQLSQQGVAEATGDPKFDKMLKGITGKKQVAKQQKADTKQQARDAFGGMFGGGNPANSLGIRKKSVDEGNDLNVGIEAYGVHGENNKKWRKTFKSQAAFEKWLDAHQDDVEVLGTREVNVNDMFKEDVPKGWQATTQPDGSTRISKQGSMSSAEYKQNMADYKAKNWTPEKMADYSQRMASGQGYTDAERSANYQQQQKSFGQYADQPQQGVEEGYADDDEYYDQDDQESELYSGCYVRDEQDPSGEIFQMRGDPTERRVQILDRNGSGWNISPERLTLVGEGDPDIARYFGSKIDEQGVAEGDDKFGSMMNKITSPESVDAREALALIDDLMHQAGASYQEALQQSSVSYGIKPAKLNALYKQRESRDAFDGMFGGGNPASNLGIKEEQLDELSPKTLMSYSGKAHSDAKDRLTQVKAGAPNKKELISKAEKRVGGIKQAHSKVKDPEYGKKVVDEDWSNKYKRSIDCSNPKGFSQKAHCAGRKKNEDINEDIERYVEALSRAGYEITEAATMCPECGGPAYEDKMLAEKQDACYHKVKSRYKVWPSAYASGALVRCRKAGAKNWGNKSKK
jgi:SAM-dependent methyltransferase